jgi:hypothetical protein
MSTHQDGALGAFLQLASGQAQIWVRHWLVQLRQALRLQEQEAHSFVEKQAMGQARLVLARYHEEVAKRFLAEIAVVVQDAGESHPAVSGEKKPTAFSLDALSLVDHDAVQEKVELTRVQQVVRMGTEEALPALDALLSRVCGFEVVRTDVNPLHPNAIVAALSRALATLHLDEAVRAQWLQTGAVLLGAELTRFYRTMAAALARQGVKPAGYVVVQRSESRSLPAAPGASHTESPAVGAEQRVGPNLTLDHLHELLASTLKATPTGDAGASGQSQGLACSLACEVVTQMMQRCSVDDRLLPNVRLMVRGLEPALMQLARARPEFFADPSNPARRLFDAIALQGAVYVTEFAPGFEEFADRTHRVLGALQSADADLPTCMVAALQRFRGPVEVRDLPLEQQAGPATPEASASRSAQAAEQDEEEPPEFMDTLPLERELMPMDLSPRGSRHTHTHPSSLHRPA